MFALTTHYQAYGLVVEYMDLFKKGELGQLDTAGARSISDFGSRNVISGRCTTPDGLRDIKHRKNDPTDAVGSPGYPVDRPILPISISDF